MKIKYSKSVNLKNLKMKLNGLKLEIKKIKEFNAIQDRKIINLQFQLASMSQIIKENELILEDSLKDKEKEKDSLLEILEDNPNLLIINKVPYKNSILVLIW